MKNPSTTLDGREFLKDSIRLQTDFSQTDQRRGVPAPPIEKPFDPETQRVTLTHPGKWESIEARNLTDAIGRRESHRRFADEALTLEELSYLLWSTQGVRRARGAGSVLRTVPSAGCRHAFETYLAISNVTGLNQGIYRYLPLENELVLESSPANLQDELILAALGQNFVGQAAVTFVWTVIPYRMEWRYGAASYKVIALDAGHVCQNLYLACESIGSGTCAIAAYHQQMMDALFQVDGEDEFVIYLAPVGKVN
jgi:SagB-type dehydrogenase family enzyme